MNDVNFDPNWSKERKREWLQATLDRLHHAPLPRTMNAKECSVHEQLNRFRKTD